MSRLEATPRFYLERLRSQVEQARGRQYPDSGDVPARWLARIARQLVDAEASLDSQSSDLEAELAHVTIVRCYEDLEVLRRADTSQVSYPVVQALRRWFVATDPDCDYLFASGIAFEITTIEDDDGEDAHGGLRPKTIQIVTMPGGALGSALHIPLVAHELGHVLARRLADGLRDRLWRSFEGLSASTMTEEDSAIVEAWMIEVFADTVCGFVTGPAGYFALHEKLRGSPGFNSEYPPNRLRIESLAAYVVEVFGPTLERAGIRAEDWAKWPTGDPATAPDEREVADKLRNLARAFVGALAAIRTESLVVANEHLGALRYGHDRLEDDLGLHLEDFYHAIPPFERRGPPARPTDVVSILNVAWFIAAFRLERLQIKVENVGRKLVRLDHLVFKAIELAEARHVWENAA